MLHLMAESEEELKSLLLRVKEENEKVACQHSKNGFQSCHFIANRRGKSENRSFFLFFFFFCTPKSPLMVTTAMNLKDTCSLEGSYDKPRQHIKKQRHQFAYKGPYSQAMDLFSSHVWMFRVGP